MDKFRAYQRKESLDGSPNKGGRNYGCYCCRKHRDLNEHKKYSRRKAKVGLKEETRKEILDESK